MGGEEMYKIKGVVGTVRVHLLDPSRLWIHNHLSYQINTKEKYVFVINFGDLIMIIFDTILTLNTISIFLLRYPLFICYFTYWKIIIK